MLGLPAEQAQLQHHEEDRHPSNVVGAGDDIASEQEQQGTQQQGTQAGPLGESVDKNLEKPEDDRAKAIEEQMEQIEPVTVESSPEWGGGTLIEEEQDEAQEKIPLTPAVNPDKTSPKQKRHEKGERDQLRS